jgi:hypothetical protein
MEPIMSSAIRTTLRHFMIAASAAIVANGCLIDRGPLVPSWSQVEPQQFCTGDTLRASYDFLGMRTCPAGVDCSPFFPTVAVSSSPMSFSPMSFRDYSAGFNFTPAGDSVTVTFDIDRDSVLIPTDEFRDGTRVFLQRPGNADANRIARRITGAIDTELVIAGMCAGALPTYTPASVETLPQFSTRLGLNTVCNTNSIDVDVTLRTASGESYSTTLLPGGCLSTSMPGVPAALRGTQLIEARPRVLPPGTMCSATGPNTPPPTLRLTTNRSCG